MFKGTPPLPRPLERLLISIKNRTLELPWVDRVILYGSFARGNYNEQSDLDIAVFARRNMPHHLEQYRQLAALSRTDVIDVQMQLFSVDELDDPCGIVEEVVEYGYDITGL